MAVQWFSAGLGWLIAALAVAVVVFGGSALVMYRRDVRALRRDDDQ